MADISALNARYGIPGQLGVQAGAGQLAVVKVANVRATATIALQGAQVVHWSPVGQHPVIWLSGAARFASGKSIRGGIPLCWPWFGPHPTEPAFPAHGFARTSPWEILETQALADGVWVKVVSSELPEAGVLRADRVQVRGPREHEDHSLALLQD